MKKLFAVLCIVLMMLGGMAMVGCEAENGLDPEEMEDTDF